MLIYVLECKISRITAQVIGLMNEVCLITGQSRIKSCQLKVF